MSVAYEDKTSIAIGTCEVKRILCN